MRGYAELAGRAAIVTGASRGIGAATARLLAAHGVHVVLAARGLAPMQALVNPVIEPLGEETMLRWEGCLSVPGLRGAVPRWRRIRYAGMDLDGRPVERVVSGYHAGLVQHEFDHLDGILYPARMTDFSLFGFNEEMAKYPPEPEVRR